MPSTLASTDFGLVFDALPTPHLVLAPDQTVVAANAAAAAWLSQPAGQLSGQPAALLLPLPDPAATWAGLLAESAAPSAEQRVELKGADGVLRPFTLRAVAAGPAQYLLSPAPPAPAPELARPQEPFRQLSEFIPQLVWTTDAQGHPSYFNQRWRDYTGHAGLEAPDPAWTAALHPDDQPAALQRWAQALAATEPYRAELRLRAQSGPTRWFLVQALPLRDAQGRVSQWLATCTDIDEAKRVQRRLLAKDRQLQQILGQVPAYVATVFGAEHLVSFATPNFLALPGGRLRVGWPLAQELPELAAQGIVALLDEAYRTGRVVSAPTHPIDWQQTGERRYYDLTLQPLLTEQPPAHGVLLFAVDVTQQVLVRQRHERLTATVRRRNEQVRALTEALPLISFSQAPSGRPVYVSPQWAAFLGLPDAGRAEDWRRHLHPDDVPVVLSTFARARREQRPWTAQLRLRSHGGEYRWHLGRSLPVFDPAGRLSRWYGSLTDVHEQQELAERLRHSEQQFRFLADTVPLFTWTATPDGQIDYANQRFLDYTGQTPGEVARGGWLALVHPDDQAHTKQRWADSMRSGQDCQVEHRVRGVDGQYRWFLVRATPMRGADGSIVKWYGSSTDVHEQFALQQELRQSEEQFRFLADSIPQLVWTLAPDGTVEFLNEGWLDYTRLSVEEVHRTGWGVLVPEAEREEATRVLAENVRLGRYHEHENRLRRAADGQFRWHLHRARPMRDAEGRILRWFGTSTDIDDQKRFQHELEARNAELLRINQDLDNFVYTASHDLRQPIDNMAGIFQELARSARYDDPDAPALVTMFEHSLEQIYTTIKELSALVQTQKQSLLAAPEEVRLERLTQEVLHSIGEQVRAVDAVVETDFSEVPAVEFVRPNLQSVLYNLISNAVKYHDPARRLHLRVWTERDATGHPVLLVQDNGLGIDLARHGKELFQLFRRFHDHVPGSGTGLYLVQRLVQAHGGQLEVDSTPGVGTTFRVRLPVGSAGSMA